jgi:hypothetical protein
VLITQLPSRRAHACHPREVVCDIIGEVIKWTQSARKHRIGRSSAPSHYAGRRVPTVMADGKLPYVAGDERGRELEIIAIPLDGGDLLVIHVIPTILRRRNG